MVEPTPPAGLPVAPAGPAPAPGSARAEAPAFAFSAAAAAQVPGPATICPRCQTRNPTSGRFCVSCGTPIEPSTAGAPAPQVQPRPQPAPAPQAPVPVPQPALQPQPAPHEPLRPAAAVHLAPEPARPAPAALVCDRCQGVCEAGMRFCKFCGAPLVQADRPAAPEPLGRSPEYSKGATRQGIQAAVEEAARQAASLSPKPAPVAPQPVAPVRPPEPAPDDKRSAATGPYAPFQSPGAQAFGRIVIIAGDGQEGPSYPIAGDQIDLGRNEGTVVLPEDRYMSPRHARLVRKDGGWYVRDLGSTNGVFVRLKAAHELVDGDLLLLGVEVLRFEVIMDAELGLGPAVQHGTLVFGSPALPRPARLVQRTVEGVARDVYHLHRLETVMGRESGDIVFTDDPYMSRRHAAIRKDAASGKFTLVDLDSSNGTFIAVRGDCPVRDGDSIRVGQHLFRIELSQA